MLTLANSNGPTQDLTGTATMAASVIHFGVDDCHRIKVLEIAGYFVRNCGSLRQLRATLLEENSAAAVFMSEGDGVPPRAAILIARTHSSAPVVLFKGPCGYCEESEFDLVVPTLTPPEIWLNELNSLVARSKDIRSRSQSLIRQSAELRRLSGGARQKSQDERQRSIVEYARNAEQAGADWSGSDINPEY
jgi:hypothetical protein